MRAALVVCLSLIVIVALCLSGCAPKAPAGAKGVPGTPGTPPGKPDPWAVDKGNSPGSQSDSMPSEGSDLGERIAKDGVGMNGQRVASTGGSERFQKEPGGCLGCHNVDGRGRKTPKGEIPPIHYAALRGGDKPEFPSDDAVIAAIREGKGEDGGTLSAIMPRWKLSDKEAAALLAYLKVLDSAQPAPSEAKSDEKSDAKAGDKAAPTPEAKPAEKAKAPGS